MGESQPHRQDRTHPPTAGNPQPLKIASHSLPNRRLAVDGGFALAKCAERPFLASSGGHEREGVRLGGTPSREVVLGWYLPSPERSAGLGEVSLDVGQVLQVG